VRKETAKLLRKFANLRGLDRGGYRALKRLWNDTPWRYRNKFRKYAERQVHFGMASNDAATNG